MQKLLTIVFVLPLIFLSAAEGNAADVNCVGGSCPVEPPGNTAANEAVVRVVNETAHGRNLGSGTLVELDAAAGGEAAAGFVLTCGHLFDAGSQQGASQWGGSQWAGSQRAGRITVSFPDGRNYTARLLGVDRQWDLAVLKIARPRAVAVTIATVAPRPGQWLSSCGYGRDGRYWCNQGQAKGYVRPQGTQSFETLEISGIARQGDSGGPVFNQRGELVAVLWGTNGRIVGGTYCGRIRIFLARLFGAPSENRPMPRQPGTVAPYVQRPVVPIRREGDSQPNGGLTSDDKVLSKAVGLLRQRLKGLETRLDGSELGEKARAAARDVARDAAGRIIEDFLAQRGEEAAVAWVPGLMAALGWTGPPAIAATVGITVLGRILRRRRKKKRGQDDRMEKDENIPLDPVDPVQKPPGIRSVPLNDSYAAQLADVFALSGHSPTADATLGREYDVELRRAQNSSDGALASWARDLRERVAQRFYRIHDRQPMPAEPVE